MWSSAKSPRVPRLSRVLRYDFRLSSLRWNQCPACLGITVQLRLESVSNLRRNSHLGAPWPGAACATTSRLSRSYRDPARYAPSPKAPRPRRTAGKRIRPANGVVERSRGSYLPFGTSRPSPGTCAGNQRQGSVSHFPPRNRIIWRHLGQRDTQSGVISSALGKILCASGNNYPGLFRQA